MNVVFGENIPRFSRCGDYLWYVIVLLLLFIVTINTRVPKTFFFFINDYCTKTV